MKFTAAIATAILAFTSSTSAHLLLSNPVGFAGTSQDPLAENGSNFPCGSGGYNVAKMNHWKAGSTQTVRMIGTAVHSGGSCQFAISTDAHPNKNSKWRVIHSVIGGCPMNMPDGTSMNADQFLKIPASATWPIPDKFPVKIPKDVPNGKVTFAWIWFNKTGNREMYMKCAPITITDGASNANAFNKRPEIFKANIGNGCHTTAGVNVNFPHPGSSSEKRGTVKGNGFTGNCGGKGKRDEDTLELESEPGECGEDGSIVCFGQGEFGICNGGKATPQPVAAGNKCVDGGIHRRSVGPVRRRHGGSLIHRAVNHIDVASPASEPSI